MSYLEDERRKFGFIQGDDGEIYFAGRANIAADEFANVFLRPGEHVTFEPGARPVDTKHPEALSVTPSRVEETQSAPSHHREELVVTAWNPRSMSGMASRPNGKGPWFYINFREVLTYGFVSKGTLIWSGIRRSNRDPKKFECHSVEIIKDESPKEI
jgi:hypothetical protein